MALDPVKNFAKVTVSTGYTVGDLAITLLPSQVSLLPDPAVDGAFNLVWWNSSDYDDPADDPNKEIVRVTAIVGNILTVTRAQEGTTATDKNDPGSIYKMILAPTKKTIDDINTSLQSGASIIAPLVLTGSLLLGTLALSLAGLTGLGTANQMVGMNNAANAYEYKTITGTSNQITVTNGAGTLTFSFAAGARSNLGAQTLMSKTVGPAGTYADYTTDGTADEVQINLAISDVNTAGGGKVTLLSATYNAAANVQLKSNVDLTGQGYSTLINIEDGSIRAGDAVTNVTVSNLRMDGENNDFSVDSIVFNVEDASDITLRDCWITNAYGFGIFIEANANKTVERIKVLHNHVQNKGNQDCLGGGPHNSTNCFVKNVTIDGNMLIKDITAGGTNKNAWDMVAVEGLTFVNNTCYGYVNSGFEQHYPSKIIFANNRIHRTIGAASGDYTELSVDTLGSSSTSPFSIGLYNNHIFEGRIRVEGRSSADMVNVNIEGNIVNSRAGASNQNGIMINKLYYANIQGNQLTGIDANDGIQIGATCGSILCANNIVRHYANGINDLSANLTNTIANNQIFDCTVYIAGTPLGAVHNNIGANPIKRHAQGNVTGATTFNRANGDEITATLTGNITVTLTAPAGVDDELTLILTQDATGGRTATWPATFKQSGDLVLTTTASAVDVIHMKYDGTNWREMGRAMNQGNATRYLGSVALTGSTASGGDTTITSTLHATKGSVWIDALDLSPLSSDLGSLGTASLMWSDMYLASGSVINWNNGDLLLTHSTNSLALTGGVFTVTGADSDAISLRSGASGNYVGLVMGRTATEFRIMMAAGTGQWSNASRAGDIVFRNDSASSFVILQSGGGDATMVLTDAHNVKVGMAGGIVVRGTTEGTNHIDIFNGTAPVGTLTNGVSLYSASGELRSMDSGGTSTLLSPHDDDNFWVFDSEDTLTGKKLHIDVEKLLRFVNDHFGLNFIKGYMARV